MKRLIDVTFALVALIVTIPLAILVAAAVKASSRGPVIFRARRIGVNGRVFHMLKFRTMRADPAAVGPAITPKDDPRVTKVGTWLRRTKLDEWPQLLNVVIGDMSLVGPRPEDPEYVARYTAEQRALLSVRPGITSPASLAFRHETALLDGADWERRYREEILPAKLAIDLQYFSGPVTVGSDLRILWRTLRACSKETVGTIRARGNTRFPESRELPLR